MTDFRTPFFKQHKRPVEPVYHSLLVSFIYSFQALKYIEHGVCSQTKIASICPNLKKIRQTSTPVHI